MNYKKVINKQIKILQKRQQEMLENGISKSEEIGSITNMIAELAVKASLIPERGQK